MKMINKLGLAGAVAILSATGLSAQQTTTLPSDRTTTLPADTRPLTGDYLTKANKASGLIGMDVRNQQNEKLGDIKDLVVDLHSGKIAYAVLSVGGFLGIGDKYIAVPTSELTAGADGKELILNADKAKIQNAPGFDKSNWPSLTSSTWGTHSTYWTPDSAAVGTAGIVHSGRDTGGTLKSADEHSFAGRITAVDRTAGTFTVQGTAGKHEFKMRDRTDLNAKTTTQTGWENLKVGDQVTVRFHNLNGSYVADDVMQSNRLDTR